MTTHPTAPRVERLEPRELPAAAFSTLPVVPADDAATAATVREIAARGAALGRSADSLLVVGDSNSAVNAVNQSRFLSGFGDPAYDPVAAGLAALRPDLLATLAAYRATGSFGHDNPAAYPGFRAADSLAELPIALAAAPTAGVAVVMIGTNDVLRATDPAAYRAELGDIVGALEAAGVVPVLSTIPPDTAAGGANAAATAAVNQTIADVAAAARLPVWNVWRGLQTVPGYGLGPDGIHLTHYGSGAVFNATALTTGQTVRNLEALDVLAWVRRAAGPRPAGAWAALRVGDVAVGAAENQPDVVTVLDPAGRVLDRFSAFETGFTGGVRVAVADVTGDGVPDVIVGAGAGGGPAVRVFSGADGAVAASYFAFEPTFRGGVSLAVADLDGDGAADIVTGAGAGGGPAVAVYRGRTFTEAARYFAYEPAFRGGVDVAAGPVAGVGPAVVTGAGAGGGPVVKVFRLGAAAPVQSYFAAESAARTGITVAVDDATGVVRATPAGGTPQPPTSAPAAAGGAAATTPAAAGKPPTTDGPAAATGVVAGGPADPTRV